MSKSGFTRPKFSDISKRVYASMVTFFGGTVPTLDYSPLGALSNALSGVSYDMYGVIDSAIDDTFIQFAKADALDRSYIGIVYPRKGATNERVTITVTNSSGSTVNIPASSVVATCDGVSLSSIIGYSVAASGTVAITLEAAPFTIPSPLTNITISATYSALAINATSTISPASDKEDDESYRQRLLSLLKSPKTGSKKDYYDWSMSVVGVRRAFVYEAFYQANSVHVIIEPISGANAVSVVNSTKSFLDTVRTVGSMVTVSATVYEPVNFVISGMSPTPSAATQSAILAELADLFATRSAPGQVFRKSWIWDAVANTSGVDYFDLLQTDQVTAITNYVPLGYNVPSLGTVTFI